MEPYQPAPTTHAPIKGSNRLPRSTLIGLLFGGICSVLLFVLLCRLLYVFVRYPNLYDPSAGPVGYWPELEVEFGAIAAVMIVCIGAPVLFCSIATYQKIKQSRIAPVDG